MIVVEKTSWLRILFHFRGTAIRRIWRRIAFVTVVAVIVTYLDKHVGELVGEGTMFPSLGFLLEGQDPDGRGHMVRDLTPLPFTLIGLALSIFLGFRNNTSYDRFWEGRKLWGSMVNTTRSITRQILTLVGPIPEEFDGRLTDGHRSPYKGELPSPEARVTNPDVGELLEFHKEMVHRVAAYVHCFRMHLRDEQDLSELRRLISDAEVDALATESNRPVAILQTLGERFRDAWERGWIHPMHLPVLEQSLSAMTDIQGGCERIKSTPIPFSYTALIHRIVALYCFGLPFGLVNTIEEFTPVVVMIISYAFFGLDAVGDEIEDPFGTDFNDLPLSTLSTMIEVNIRQRIGDEDLPKIPTPVNEILS